MVRSPFVLGPLVALALTGCSQPGEQPTPLDAHALSPGSGLEPGLDAGPGGEAHDAEGAAAGRRAREAARRELPRLLPLEPGVVRWYEVRRAGSERPRRVALLTTPGEGRGDAGLLLEAVGLAPPGEPTLRLWRGEDEVWLLPAGALGPEVGHAPYRAWTVDTAWDDGPEGRGRRAPAELSPTPLGALRVVQVDHARSGDVLVRHVFAPEHGLVSLEVVVRRETALRLDLVEASPRGTPAGGYDASAPAACWQSVGEALRRADVDGLARLMGPALRPRLRTSAWERVRDLAPDAAARAEVAPLAERVRHEVGELLELDVRVRGPWSVAGDEALAPAFVTPPGDGPIPRTVRGHVVLRWRPDEVRATGAPATRPTAGAWRWVDVRLP